VRAPGVGEAIGEAPRSLTARRPLVPPERLLAELEPAARFGAERFATYRPAADQPSQARALAACERFAAGVAGQDAGGGYARWWRRRPAATQTAGVYLDGGFGVGKTHLLASMWHAVHEVQPGGAAFGTFVEYTNLVGALGFRAAVDGLAGRRLVCIDEFELDDPGDTVLMSRLLRELDDAGVRLAATSNTLPDALGEGRFAADDFRREIQALAARFEVLRVDGPDYRHRGTPTAPEPPDDDTVRRWAGRRAGTTLDAFPDLLDHLAQVHPSRYGALLDAVHGVGLTGLRTVDDQAVALRLVVLVDRLYDRDLPLVAGGLGVDRVFAPELLSGGYRAKYRRALSRLVALAHQGHAELVSP